MAVSQQRTSLASLIIDIMAQKYVKLIFFFLIKKHPICILIETWLWTYSITYNIDMANLLPATSGRRRATEAFIWSHVSGYLMNVRVIFTLLQADFVSAN